MKLKFLNCLNNSFGNYIQLDPNKMVCNFICKMKFNIENKK